MVQVLKTSFSSKILTFSLVLASLDKQSVRDPKVFAQLIKNSKRHNIPLLMKELKEDFHNGSTFSPLSQINHPPKVGFPNHNSAAISHPTPYSSEIKRKSLIFPFQNMFLDEKISHIEVPKEIEDAVKNKPSS